MRSCTLGMQARSAFTDSCCWAWKGLEHRCATGHELKAKVGSFARADGRRIHRVGPCRALIGREVEGFPATCVVLQSVGAIGYRKKAGSEQLVRKTFLDSSASMSKAVLSKLAIAQADRTRPLSFRFMSRALALVSASCLSVTPLLPNPVFDPRPSLFLGLRPLSLDFASFEPGLGHLGMLPCGASFAHARYTRCCSLLHRRLYPCKLIVIKGAQRAFLGFFLLRLLEVFVSIRDSVWLQVDKHLRPAVRNRLLWVQAGRA